jgi:hypothetical protein
MRGTAHQGSVDLVAAPRLRAARQAVTRLGDGPQPVHVRFEEARVFELAQRRLPSEVLERIARRTPPPSAMV